MYVVGNTNDTIYQYTLSTPFDVSTASYASKSFGVGGEEPSPTDLALSEDGTAMYVVGNTNDTVYQYTLSTPFDASTASYASKSFSVTGEETVPRGLALGSDGENMYALGSTNDTIYQYTGTSEGSVLVAP
jgi:sugar lactone lactonase YvrE